MDPILGAYLDGSPSGGIYVTQNLSLYHYSAQNPVRFKDDNGEFINFVVGAAVGFGADIVTQVAVSVITGQELDLDMGSAFQSAALGATGVGIANVASKGAKLITAARQLSPGKAQALAEVADVSADAVTSVVSRSANGQEDISFGDVLGDVAAGQVGGRSLSALAKKRAVASETNANLSNAIKRAERMANPYKSNGSKRKIGRPQARQERVGALKSVQESFIEGKAARAGIVGSGASSAVKDVYTETHDND